MVSLLLLGLVCSCHDDVGFDVDMVMIVMLIMVHDFMRARVGDNHPFACYRCLRQSQCAFVKALFPVDTGGHAGVGAVVVVVVVVVVVWCCLWRY